MKQYDIWMSGWQSNEGKFCAEYCGSVKANSFREACDKMFKGNRFYNSENLTYWNCHLYDNETDARKSFG